MKTKDTGKTRNRYERKEDLSSSLAAKNASREAQEEDLNAGFQGSAPIFSSRTLKSDTTELAKKSSGKRKFNFDQIFDDCDEISIDKTASQTSTANVKKSSSSSKSIGKRGGILLSSAISTSSIGDVSTIEDIVVSKQNPTSKSKRANNLRGSRFMIEEQSLPMIRKKFDYAKYLSEGKPLSTMIVSQRAAAVNPNQTYQDPESSEDEKRSKIPVKKKKSKNQNDFEYSEEKERPDLDIFRLQSFDLPVVKRNFEGKSIDLSKFKIKSNELIGENQQRCPIGLFCDALLPKTLSPRLEKALEKYIDLKEQCSVGKVSRDAVVGARDQFCLLHQAEDSIIPIGIKKGYLIDINFSQIPSRLETYSSRFNSIISKKLDSTFLQDSLDVISSVGQAKARGLFIFSTFLISIRSGYSNARSREITMWILRNHRLQLDL